MRLWLHNQNVMGPLAAALQGPTRWAQKNDNYNEITITECTNRNMYPAPTLGMITTKNNNKWIPKCNKQCTHTEIDMSPQYPTRTSPIHECRLHITFSLPIGSKQWVFSIHALPLRANLGLRIHRNALLLQPFFWLCSLCSSGMPWRTLACIGIHL